MRHVCATRDLTSQFHSIPIQTRCDQFELDPPLKPLKIERKSRLINETKPTTTIIIISET